MCEIDFRLNRSGIAYRTRSFKSVAALWSERARRTQKSNRLVVTALCIRCVYGTLCVQCAPCTINNNVMKFIIWTVSWATLWTLLWAMLWSSYMIIDFCQFVERALTWTLLSHQITGPPATVRLPHSPIRTTTTSHGRLQRTTAGRGEGAFVLVDFVSSSSASSWTSQWQCLQWCLTSHWPDFTMMSDSPKHFADTSSKKFEEVPNFWKF